MDFTVLIFVAISLLVVAAYYAFFKSKEEWQFDEVIFILGLDVMDDIVPLAKIVAKKLGLPEEDADKYSKIAADTLEYLRSLPDEDKEEIIDAGIQYSRELCMEFGLEVDADMEKVIEFTVKAAHFLIEQIEKEDDDEAVTTAVAGKVKAVHLKKL